MESRPTRHTISDELGSEMSDSSGDQKRADFYSQLVTPSHRSHLSRSEIDSTEPMSSGSDEANWVSDWLDHGVGSHRSVMNTPVPSSPISPPQSPLHGSPRLLPQEGLDEGDPMDIDVQHVTSPQVRKRRRQSTPKAARRQGIKMAPESH